MSDSVRPHRRQPTRLPCPWDSPGKNTGVGCHFLLQCTKVKSESEVAQLCPTLCDPMDYSLPVSSVHEISQARVLEWGAIAFSQRISKVLKIHFLKCLVSEEEETDSTKMTSFHQLTSKYNVEWCCSGQDTSSQEIILPRSFSEGLI